MNIRIAKLKLGINSLIVEELNKATQADKNTHFLELSFDDTVTLDGYSLLVMFKLPYPSKEVVVEEIANVVKENQRVTIPNACLKSSGKLNIEFALKKNEELITVNKSLAIEVIRTINGTYFSGIAGEELQKTIDSQVAEIKELLANIENIQADFNENAANKTYEFNKNSITKIEEFNKNTEDKTIKFNENSSTKTNEFNSNTTTKTNEFNTLVEHSKIVIKEKATESANVASSEANKQVIAQQDESITKVREATMASLSYIEDKKKQTINNFNENAADKTELFNSNVTSKTYEFNKNSVSKTNSFDNNVNTKTKEFNTLVENSKIEIDDYVEEHKIDLKGDKGDTGQSAFNEAGRIQYPNGMEEWIEL